MAKDVSLLTLPVEILCDIILLLDPITLISFSQTSRQLRATIQPSKNDFVQRLLALELMPEHGGIIPMFRSRDNHIEPAFEHPDWDRNKYACSGCLKLRSHKCFDNHAVLSLNTRKPPPDSPEACKPADWVPLDLTAPGAQWRRRQKLAAEEAARLAPFRQTYKWYCGGIYSEPWNLMRDNYKDIDARGAAAEKMVCGLARHKRLCIECRRLRGDFAKQIARGQAPMVMSRPVRLPNEFAMYFPGLVEDLPVARRPTLFNSMGMAVGRPDPTEETCFPRIVYCDSCGGWYNIAAFQQYEDRCWTPRHTGLVYGGDKCIMCSLTCMEESGPGRPPVLTRFAWKVEAFVDRKMNKIADRIMFGWSRLRDDFFGKGGLLRDHAEWAHENLESLSWAPDWAGAGGDPDDPTTPPSTTPPLALLQEAGPGILRVYYTRVRKYIKDNVDPDTFDDMYHSWFRQWWDDYALNHLELVRMAGIVARIDADGHWVGYYAMERAPWRIC